jgi:hypothetical protein
VFDGPFSADRPDLSRGALTYGSAGPSPPLPAAAPAAAAGAASDVAGVSSQTAEPRFGPRVAVLQLYIDDLLGGKEPPAACARAVVNLLTGFNPELRGLYDRYWCGNFL